jgi:hypothetical protein
MFIFSFKSQPKMPAVVRSIISLNKKKTKNCSSQPLVSNHSGGGKVHIEGVRKEPGVFSICILCLCLSLYLATAFCYTYILDTSDLVQIQSASAASCYQGEGMDLLEQ